MSELKDKKVVIHSAEEFVKIYLPKSLGKKTINDNYEENNFGLDLAKKVFNKLEIK
jgi:hypothetical protein